MIEMNFLGKGLIRRKRKPADVQFIETWLRVFGVPMNGKGTPGTFSSERLRLHFFSCGFLSDGRHHSRIFTGFQGKEIAINFRWRILVIEHRRGHPLYACLLYTSPSPRDGL